MLGRCEIMHISNDECIRRRTAREILSIIERICFSEECREFRVNRGSNGQRDLIIQRIKEEYDIG